MFPIGQKKKTEDVAYDIFWSIAFLQAVHKMQETAERITYQKYFDRLSWWQRAWRNLRFFYTDVKLTKKDKTRALRMVITEYVEHYSRTPTVCEWNYNDMLAEDLTKEWYEKRGMKYE